jgi:glutamate dehydrogenase (NAD(P)+)
VMAPDMGTNEQVMAWFMDTYSMYQGRTVTEIVTGKPVASGGTLGRREATGRGVAYLAGRVMKELSIDLNNATAVIQGFGNVGSYAALGLHQFGLKVIAVSDHTGALYDATGLDIPALMRHAGEHGSIAGFSSQLQFDPAQILTLPCDVLVPAAMERVIDAHVADNLKCRVLAEGANGPTTRRRRGQLFRMGAGPAAAILGRRGSDAARISHSRPRLRPDGVALQGRQGFPPHRRDGDRC